ncbi:MAG: ROK family protein [Eubacteriales bacterium]|nr:ROK family protein [Eubacteriales bacterium]
MKNYLVLDGGGTFTKYALMDENAVILEKDKVPTPYYEDHTKEDYYQVLDGIVEKYRGQISGIAFSMPGMLDSIRGFAMTAGFLNYLSNTPVASELSLRYGIPVTIENDGKCAALAEFWKGSLKDCTNGAVVVLGTGVAGGIIIDRKLYRGSRFTAGEYSYMCVDDRSRMELDSYLGMTGGAQGLAKAVAKRTGTDWQEYDGIEIFRLANAGDELVLKGLRDFTDALGTMIYNLNILLDLDVIAIGGGVSQQPLLHQYLKQSIQELMVKHPIRKIAPYIPEPNITNCRYYNDANLIGALYHYMTLNEK